MKLTTTLMSALLIAGLAQAQVIYTPVHVVIPNNGNYVLDMNQDGTADFTIRSSVGQVWCQRGDGAYWSLAVIPSKAGAIVVGESSEEYADALPVGWKIDAGETWGFETAELEYYAEGYCGRFIAGNWFNRPMRFLGLQFQASDGTHYGWAELYDIAYFDDEGNPQASTIVTGFAYEATPGKAITTGGQKGAGNEAQ